MYLFLLIQDFSKHSEEISQQLLLPVSISILNFCNGYPKNNIFNTMNQYLELHKIINFHFNKLEWIIQYHRDIFFLKNFIVYFQY